MFFFFSSRRRHTRCGRDWSSDVCSSDLEMRLYYYSAPGMVESYPISVGRDGFSTPVGVTRTTVKVKDPHWSPPRSMRAEAAARGEPPPAVVPPGPDTPLGRHAILLGIPSYLIHGTNRPDGVGMSVSRGCIRMFPEDIDRKSVV